MAFTIQNRRRTFDEAKRALGDDLREVVEGLRLKMQIPIEGAQLHLVGRSESTGEFESWMATSESHPGIEAYETKGTGTTMLPWSGACDAETQRLASFAAKDPVRFDLETDGLALMEGQMRAFPQGIGGFCQLTFVNDAEITTRILRRWPEPVAA